MYGFTLEIVGTLVRIRNKGTISTRPPIAIAINIVLGQTVAAALKVPIYLDSIGTIFVGVVAFALLAFLHPQRQFLHDVVCGTRLVTWHAKSPR